MGITAGSASTATPCSLRKVSNRERDGKWRAIDLKLARPETTVRTRKGYRALKA